MKVDTQIEKVKALFTAYLETKNLRKTVERFKILDTIYEYNGHFDVDALYLKMKEANIQVSRATVYNTLDLLESCNLVVKHQFGQNLAQYEKAFGYRQHDHLICTDCQKVTEFCDPRIQNIQQTVESCFPYKVMYHSLILYATCTKTDCANKLT